MHIDDAASGRREHALRLAEPRLDQVKGLRSKVVVLADDPSARVRFQVAFTHGEIEGRQAVEGLARIARRDAETPGFAPPS